MQLLQSRMDVRRLGVLHFCSRERLIIIILGECNALLARYATVYTRVRAWTGTR